MLYYFTIIFYHIGMFTMFDRLNFTACLQVSLYKHQNIAIVYFYYIGRKKPL